MGESLHFDRAQHARIVAVWQATLCHGQSVSAQRHLIVSVLKGCWDVCIAVSFTGVQAGVVVATSGAHLAQAVHEELCLQSCDKLSQCAVAPAVQGMQAAVQKGLDSQAASLTEHNDALAQLIALLEQVDATSAAQQSQHSVQQCSAPCVDLRQYPILHSSACICAQGSLAGMRVDADEAARHAGRAILGKLSKTSPCNALLTRLRAI